MTIILICGANAGTFSPFALTGIIANGLIDKLGLPMDPWVQVFWPNFLAETLLASMAYLLFCWRLGHRKLKSTHDKETHIIAHDPVWNQEQKVTLLAIALLITGGVFFRADIGFLALLLGCCLTLIKASEGKEVLRHIPWETILMVCGVNTLIGILEHLGGIDLLTSLIAQISNPVNVTAVTAFITGIISAFSSSSGVVLPTFIPVVPDLIAKIGGGNEVSIISSINVGAHLVDISPLSSLGALCLASALHEDREKLFRHLLGFGLSMAVVGSAICFLLFR
jgi:Na+/H+ antiporter NhaD/arsenite permease-like protein